MSFSVPEKRSGRRIAWVVCLCFLVLSQGAIAQTLQPKTALPSGGQTPAQRAPSGTPQAPQQTPQWVVGCTNADSGLDCRAAQTLVYQQEGRNIQVSAVVRIAPDTKKPQLILQVPLGVQLPVGITIQFGKQQAKSIPFQSCNMNGCLAEYAVSQAEITSLAKGTNLTLSVRTPDNTSLRVSVPAAGFAAAYAKMTAE